MTKIFNYIKYLFTNLIAILPFKLIVSFGNVFLEYIYKIEFLIPGLVLSGLFIINWTLGLICAIKDKRFQLKRFLFTFIKIFVYLFILFLAKVIESEIGISMIFDFLIGSLVATEFISIVKNSHKLGLKLPKKIIDKIELMIKNEYSL